jgi:hypothetical protein
MTEARTSNGSGVTEVAELLQTLVKASRAFQMYPANNPIYQRASENLRAACGPVWIATQELRLQVAETDFLWEDQPVYQQAAKAESLAWQLYKDGLRELVLRPGAEAQELVRFVETVNRARLLPPDAGDDLLTLLWEQEYESIEYRFMEMMGEGEMAPGDPGQRHAEELQSSDDRRQSVQEEAPPRPKGIVDPDDFDSTLYFLDESEVTFIAREMEEEYSRDIRAIALSSLFDLYEAEGQPEVRAEILDILDTLFPNLLTKGEYRTVGSILRELRVLAERAPLLRDAEAERLRQFEGKLSEPAITQQLVASLDDGWGGPQSEGDVTEVLKELRPAALGVLVAFLPNVQTADVKRLLEGAVDRLATTAPGEVQALLRRPELPGLKGVVELCGRLKLQPTVSGLGEALGHADPEIRAAAVESLIAIGTPGALQAIERAVDDADRNVRLAAVRAVGQRGYRGALGRIEAVVGGKDLDDRDLTERMAFFEAYGAIAGTSAIETLRGLLWPRGFLRARVDPDTRACAALALGRIKAPEAREALQKCADDKELVVRTAVTKALRGFDR